jgi:hypothetical protein
MIGRVTAREPTTPLPPFRRGSPAGEQEDREVPQFLLDRERFAHEVDARDTAISP